MWRGPCSIVHHGGSMFSYARATALLLIVGGLSTAAYAQTPVPLFRATVVGRTTPAVNYRPRSGATTIDFTGTPLMPNAKGHATVSGAKGYTDGDADFKDLQPAAQFGPGNLTYVVWAIPPEGRAKNLGEL